MRHRVRGLPGRPAGRPPAPGQRADAVERALAFEKTSYRGLFHFVRYIEQLQSYNEDFGEAGVLGENEDAVRIMTIHKSKGLEFPVVIVGAWERASTARIRSRVVIHPDLGVGVDWLDAGRRTKLPRFRSGCSKKPSMWRCWERSFGSSTWRLPGQRRS